MMPCVAVTMKWAGFGRRIMHNQGLLMTKYFPKKGHDEELLCLSFGTI